MDENNNLVFKKLTKNVFKKNKIWIFDKAKLFEAVIMMLLTASLVLKINFTTTVTNVILTIACPSVFYVFIKGIKNRSVLQLLIDEIKYRRKYRQLHLRSIDYVKKQNNSIGFNIQGDSIAEKAFFIATRIIKALRKKYK